MHAVEILLQEVHTLQRARDARTLELRMGPFWTVVHTSVGAGIASTMAGEARPHQGLPVRAAGSLHELAPLQLAEMLRSDSPPEAAVGLAAVNALLGAPRGRITHDNARTMLMERGVGKRVAMIGRFPFAETLRGCCDELWVFERGSGLHAGDHRVEEMPELLPRAEIVAITATTIINHSLAEILEHVAEGAWLMMLGPSTPLSAKLFKLGFNILCGSVVEDVQAVLRQASQGAVTKQVTGVQRVSLWS